MNARKFSMRTNRASGSTRARVDLIVRSGWRPGLPSVPFYKRNARRTFKATDTRLEGL